MLTAAARHNSANTGGDLFSYLDGADLAVFSQFVGRQNASIRQHGVSTCGGLPTYWNSGIITAMVRGLAPACAASIDAPAFVSTLGWRRAL